MKSPYKTIFFKHESREIIALLCIILGYKYDEEVDESILGFLAQLHPVSNEISKWNTYVFLAQILNQELTNFPDHEIFRYPSFLFFLFLYYNFKYFEILGLNMTDHMDKDLLVHEWNPIYVRKCSKSNFIEFTNKVMRITYNVIHGIDMPRMPKEGREWLKSTPKTRVATSLFFRIIQS